MTTSLQDFIAHARSKGMDHQTIRMLLLSAGWKEKDISAALASETLDMPVPSPADAGGAKDAFFHLLTFTTMYSTIIATVVLVFEYLNRLLPDPASWSYEMYSNSDFSAIRWMLAVLMVSFPLFVFLSRTLHREFRKHPEKLASGIRRWLTYLTLFITACTLIGDVITLLFYLLEGELSTRFILKVLAVFVLSGLPFWYYFSVVRMEPAKYAGSTAHRIFFGSMATIVVLMFVWGILIVGSPMYGRSQRFDEQRVNDLRQIQSEIVRQVYGDNFYTYNGQPFTELPKPLPPDLKTVAANVTYQKININDPQTGTPYEYRPAGTRYELCAVFDLVRDQSYDVLWNHPEGRHCFSFNALEPAAK